MKISRIILPILVVAGIAGCPAKHAPNGAVTVKAESWSDQKVAQTIELLALQYRKEGESFLASRQYVWAERWTWPETVGITEKHLPMLKKYFSQGDDATKIIVLNIILMNIPAEKLEGQDRAFLSELVILDTEMKERRANVPPPTFYEEIIEEYVPTNP